ncbi:hypothetical protein K2F54_16340 [Cryobacterium sp. 1639]|uniref:hypothetical protein n=1 Tax=Cryobacterium inferilacus TaxID=2866629 RepID=UPI001C73B548|nr:hypothetical protein [Cryobacterium sp. 1639]MBX0301544.1 hypothetical protein [Cryobacterium sp. 1639]
MSDNANNTPSSTPSSTPGNTSGNETGSTAGSNRDGGQAPAGSVLPVGKPTLTDGRWEARITFLRSRAAVARAEVSAIEAMHRDPEVLEDMLVNASPDEVAMAEAVEHRISERVIAARQVADAAEADYERAVLDGPDAQQPEPS